METTLHRQLKTLYAGEDGVTEARCGAYRFDALRDGVAIEIQLGGLAALKTKLARVASARPIRLVKPVIATTTIVAVDPRTGLPTRRRKSPRRGDDFSALVELVHLRTAFPHPNITVECPRLAVEELRVPDRRPRRRRAGYRVLDVRLIDRGPGLVLRTAADLAALVPSSLADPFDTGELAAAVGQPRWCAQKFAYVLRYAGAVEAVARRRSGWVYRRCVAAEAGVAASAGSVGASAEEGLRGAVGRA